MPSGSRVRRRRRSDRLTVLVARSLALALVVAVAATACTTASRAPAVQAAVTLPAARLVDIGNGVSGPSGLAATIYASGLANASGLAFDPQGRLWVTTAAAQDAGTDGVYVVTAAGATPLQVLTDIGTPMGLLWHDDELYVSSIGRVDAFGGFDGTHFATSRTVVELPEGVGMSNGLVLGRDGRIRLGISAPCDGCAPGSELSASIVSFTPQGADLRVEVAGVRAPIGLAYVPGTDDLLVTMNQRDGLGDETPGDWLALVRAGQDWGFPACVGNRFVGADTTAGTGLDVDPGASRGSTPSTASTGTTVAEQTDCSGVPTPLAELDPHAAVSGLAIVDGQLGSSVGRAAIAAEWATGKVLRVSLAGRDGGGYDAAVTPFLTGIAKPVPVVLAPDGAVLVGDWATGQLFRIARAAG